MTPRAMTQAGSYRLAIAGRYWHTALLVFKKQAREGDHFEPLAHLLAVASELALKAYLTDKGYTDAQLGSKKLGHDLVACARRCIEAGLPMTESDIMCVLVLRTSHLSTFNRYGPKAKNGKLELGAYSMPKDDVALAMVARLIDRISGDPTKLRKRGGAEGAAEWPPTLPVLFPISLRRVDELETESKRELAKYAAIGRRHG